MIPLLTFFLGLFDLQHDAESLATAAQRAAPRYLTEEVSRHQALAAKMAETPNVPAELLLSMSFFESRHYSTAVSRMERGKRKTGIPTWSSPPSFVSGPYFCGITQAEAGLSWKRCSELQDVRVAYKKTVAELERWLKVCRGRMTCALTGYGGGFAAIKLGDSPYSHRVLSRASYLKRAQRRNS